MSIKAVIFDLDGTLMDSAPSICEALNQMRVARGGARIDSSFVRKHVSGGAKRLVLSALDNLAEDADKDVQEFRSVYGNVPPQSNQLYPGCIGMLEVLLHMKISAGICTNKPQNLSEKIVSQLGIRKYFSTIVGGDACMHHKPHPGHIYETLSKMNCSGEGVLYVGDSEVDAAAASAANIPFALVTFGYILGKIEDISRSYTINHFDELVPIIQKSAQQL